VQRFWQYPVVGVGIGDEHVWGSGSFARFHDGVDVKIEIFVWELRLEVFSYVPPEDQVRDDGWLVVVECHRALGGLLTFRIADFLEEVGRTRDHAAVHLPAEFANIDGEIRHDLLIEGGLEGSQVGFFDRHIV